MRGTRRGYATAALAAVLLALAVLVAHPLPVVGAILIGAWLVARQYQFTHALATVEATLEVEVTCTPTRVATEEPATVTLSVTRSEELPVDVTVSVRPPVAATGTAPADRTVHLEAGTTDATTAFPIEVSTAGTHAFETPTVTLTDADGLFTETVHVGDAPTLTVEPRGPRNVHVGQGGEEIAAAYGEHDAGRLGAGLEPAELRRYVAGDAADRIDWNATARLGDVYVREFEAETDRQTALLVDHRGPLATGHRGERALDYLREVALLFVASARELDDPLGLYTVGDDGLTGAWPPAASPGQYAELRRVLEALDATDETGDASTRHGTGRPPSAARSAATRLAGDDSAFGTTLRPYFAHADTYLQRIESDPLFGAARARLTKLRGSLWTVILTDDTNRTEVRETVKLARRGHDNVLVFLAPRVLFETDALGDLDAAYDRYVDFEEFRRDLARLERVAAFEVAPGDRLGAMLAARREQRGVRESSQ